MPHALVVQGGPFDRSGDFVRPHGDVSERVRGKPSTRPGTLRLGPGPLGRTVRRHSDPRGGTEERYSSRGELRARGSLVRNRRDAARWTIAKRARPSLGRSTRPHQAKRASAGVLRSSHRATYVRVLEGFVRRWRLCREGTPPATRRLRRQLATDATSSLSRRQGCRAEPQRPVFSRVGATPSHGSSCSAKPRRTPRATRARLPAPGSTTATFDRETGTRSLSKTRPHARQRPRHMAGTLVECTNAPRVASGRQTREAPLSSNPNFAIHEIATCGSPQAQLLNRNSTTFRNRVAS